MTHSNLKPMYSFDELPEGVECFGQSAVGEVGTFHYEKTDGRLFGKSKRVSGRDIISRCDVLNGDNYKDWTFYPIPIPNPEDEWADRLDKDGDFDWVTVTVFAPKNLSYEETQQARKDAPYLIKFIQYHYIDGDE